MLDGSLDTNPILTNPCGLRRAIQSRRLRRIPSFTPLLGCYDLTRTAALPASDGCPSGQASSQLYPYYGHTDVKEIGAIRPGRDYHKKLEPKHRAARRFIQWHLKR